MEIKEIKERKKTLETEIRNLLIQFTDDTGVNLKDVDVDVLETRAMGNPPKTLLGEVKVIAEIP